ncbi:MAG: transglycosylase SLT domain-containing protein [Bacteroidota bacterium]
MNSHKYKIVFIVIIFLFSVKTGITQQDTLQTNKNIEQNFHKNLDKLVYDWYLDKFEEPSDFTSKNLTDPNIPEFADSIYISRLRNLPTAIEVNYNSIVKNFIHLYTKERREKVEIMLGLSRYYFPIFERIFDEYDLPYELKYLAIIESALNPRAISRARATGIWQFMHGTGKSYGLTINSFVDERRDPVKSTYAAAEYLKDLHEMFGSWDLAIAAYNCGPRNVSKAIYRAGGKRTYWDIYYFLPRETRGYYPAFIAAMYFANYHEQHNLYPKKINLPLAADTIMVNKKLHLKQISEVLDIPLIQLENMNPQYKENIIPATNKSYSVKIPLNYTKGFIEYKDSIFAYKDSVFFPDNMLKEPGSTQVVQNAAKGKAKLYYRVKSGDNLGHIAEWYDVRASQLRYWNNIRGNIIRAGQKLVVYVPKNKAGYYKKVNSLSFAEKQKRIGTPANQKNKTTTQPPEQDKDYIYYKVKYGDTLWDISRKYPGVSENEIKKLNNLENAGELKIGQNLKIRKEPDSS